MDTDWAFVEMRSRDLWEVLAGVRDDGLSPSAWVRCQIEGSGKSRANVVRESYLDTTLGYQIISGRRRATRDKLIQLAFGMGLNIEGTCELLERYGLARLLHDSRRDVTIAYCLSRHMGVPACDEVLSRAGMEPLRKD